MRYLLCLLFCLMAGVAQAAPAGKAYMSIIIDDLGQSSERDQVQYLLLVGDQAKSRKVRRAEMPSACDPSRTGVVRTPLSESTQYRLIRPHPARGVSDVERLS